MAGAYKSIMVQLDLDAGAERRVALAARLAGRFDAQLIGIAAADPWLPIPGDPAMGMDPTIAEAQRRMAQADLDGAAALFRRAVGTHSAVAWRAAVAPSAGYLRTQSRAADLVVIGQEDEASARWHLRLAPGDVIIGLGRPMLVVPPRVARLEADCIVVGWKDAPEARRAVADSLPLLQGARKVLVTAVGPSVDTDGAEDVAVHLARHGVRATAVRREGNAANAAEVLVRTAESEGADLIVVGAYGHARLREWVLGGVTRDLLDRAPVCCLMSH